MTLLPRPLQQKVRDLNALRIAAFWTLFACQVTAPALAEPVITRDEGIVSIHWSSADQAIGEVAYVCGKVVDVSDIGNITFINFDDQRPARFSGVVFKDHCPDFPGDLKDLYLGKLVKIRGQITTYRDRPQLVITDPAQIEIVDELPATVLPAKKPWEADKGQIVVATYNVLNFFDDVDDAYHADETTPAKPREQLEQIAATIHALDADVLALQEVESRGYLKLFMDVFLNDMGYKHVVHFEGNDLRGIDVCLLSRLPVGPVTSHRHVQFDGPNDRPRIMARDLLSVTLLPPESPPLEIWVVHLKSNFGGREFAEPIRMAEAKYLRKQLDERLAIKPDAAFLVMGDFNDTWDSEALQTIVGTGSHALRLPLSEESIKSQNTYNQEPYSHSMIDFILSSPSMGSRYVKDSYRILPGSVGTSGSDHNPVSARFLLK